MSMFTYKHVSICSHNSLFERSYLYMQSMTVIYNVHIRFNAIRINFTAKLTFFSQTQLSQPFTRERPLFINIFNLHKVICFLEISLYFSAIIKPVSIGMYSFDVIYDVIAPMQTLKHSTNTMHTTQSFYSIGMKISTVKVLITHRQLSQ